MVSYPRLWWRIPLYYHSSCLSVAISTRRKLSCGLCFLPPVLHGRGASGTQSFQQNLDRESDQSTRSDPASRAQLSPKHACQSLDRLPAAQTKSIHERFILYTRNFEIDVCLFLLSKNAPPACGTGSAFLITCSYIDEHSATLDRCRISRQEQRSTAAGDG